MPTGDKPNVPRGYHAYLTMTDHFGKKRSVFMSSYDDTSWLVAEETRAALEQFHFPTLHRWRGPMTGFKDPRGQDMHPGDDMPW